MIQKYAKARILFKFNCFFYFDFNTETSLKSNTIQNRNCGHCTNVFSPLLYIKNMYKYGSNAYIYIKFLKDRSKILHMYATYDRHFYNNQIGRLLIKPLTLYK